MKLIEFMLWVGSAMLLAAAALQGCAVPVEADPNAEALELWRAAGMPELVLCPEMHEHVVSLSELEAQCGRPHCSTGAVPCAWACTFGAGFDPHMYRTDIEEPGHTAQDERTHELFHVWLACMTGSQDTDHTQPIWSTLGH